MSERIAADVYRYSVSRGQFGYRIRATRGWVTVDLDGTLVPELPRPLFSAFTCPYTQVAQSADESMPREAEPAEHEAVILVDGDGHRLLHWPQGRLLFAGHFFDEARPCASRRKSPNGARYEPELLATLLRMDLRATVTSSGQVVTEPCQLIATHLEQQRQRRQRVLEAVAHGLSTVEGITSLLAARGTSWPHRSGELRYAVRSDLAALVEEGDLTLSYRDDSHRYHVADRS